TELLDVSVKSRQDLSIPTINDPANQDLNNRFCASPTFRNCDQLKHDYQMAQLSECVYENTLCGNGYVKVNPKSVGLDVVDFEKDGFKATMYKSPNGEMILAFRGSREAEIDWDNNIAQGKGESSDYYEQARYLAWRLNKKGVKFHMTGHSLGGGLASAAALDNELSATIFNSASVHPNTVPQYWQKAKNAKKLITTYTVEDDILSDLQDITSPKTVDSKNSDGRIRATLAAVGNRIVLDNPSKDWIKQYKDSLPKGKGWKNFLSKRKRVLLHSMKAVLEALKNKVKAQCNTLI
ncbi:MAG: Mbeg1-like protein, partial [Granulosicoccaceae bacterium]